MSPIGYFSSDNPAWHPLLGVYSRKMKVYVYTNTVHKRL